MNLNDPVVFVTIMSFFFVGLFYVAVALFETVLKSKQKESSKE